MLELTQRQAEIWQFISAYQEAEGYLAARPEHPGFTPIVPGPERGDPTSAGIAVGPIRPHRV